MPLWRTVPGEPIRTQSYLQLHSLTTLTSRHSASESFDFTSWHSGPFSFLDIWTHRCVATWTLILAPTLFGTNLFQTWTFHHSLPQHLTEVFMQLHNTCTFVRKNEFTLYGTPQSPLQPFLPKAPSASYLNEGAKVGLSVVKDWFKEWYLSEGHKRLRDLRIQRQYIKQFWSSQRDLSSQPAQACSGKYICSYRPFV